MVSKVRILPPPLCAGQTPMRVLPPSDISIIEFHSLTMSPKLWHIACILLLMVLVHLAAIPLGLYRGKVWVDKPLHVLGGIALALFWLWLAGRLWGMSVPSSAFFWIVTTVSFTALGAFAWELFEFSIAAWFPGKAYGLKLYSPNLKDALFDMLFGVGGGFLLSIFNFIRSKIPNAHEGSKRVV